MKPSEQKIAQIRKYGELITSILKEIEAVVPHPSYFTPTETKMMQVIGMQCEQLLLFQQACDEAYNENKVQQGENNGTTNANSTGSS